MVSGFQRQHIQLHVDRQAWRSGRLPSNTLVNSIPVNSSGLVCKAVTAKDNFITVDQIKSAADDRGMALSMTTAGPFFKVQCRHSAIPVDEGDDRDADLVGEATGFTAPWFGILHLDQLRVFNSKIKKLAKTESVVNSQVSIQTTFGVGLLVGALAVKYAYDCGCTKAELLAIKDDDRWHARLVRYYSRLGFHAVREVGDNGLSDLPHLLVWGGAGTRMDADIELLIERWSNALRRT
eukprot:CAMPEP_0114229848 /NCGR_PEP_ID=MMETSP0058-20121206/3140_1 /TAXON_ID=36894 /ORGANISM="Pyramimonas parkeae, CCMP726" /LENGTH=236 /DNA_ID=CAMNT_0001340979 /DNA_START=8 /DNA_END=718 /DNA_ORIENTATION=-